MDSLLVMTLYQNAVKKKYFLRSVFPRHTGCVTVPIDSN